jgi:hypothetical protein
MTGLTGLTGTGAALAIAWEAKKAHIAMKLAAAEKATATGTMPLAKAA